MISIVGVFWIINIDDICYNVDKICNIWGNNLCMYMVFLFGNLSWIDESGVINFKNMFIFGFYLEVVERNKNY